MGLVPGFYTPSVMGGPRGPGPRVMGASPVGLVAGSYTPSVMGARPVDLEPGCYTTSGSGSWFLNP